MLRNVLSLFFENDRFRPAWEDRLPRFSSKSTFGNVGLVADGVAVGVQRVRHRDDAKDQFSHYRQDNVGLSVVSITAAGRIHNVSRAMGGAAAESTVIAASGLYSSLKPGEVLMYDKGADNYMSTAIAKEGAALLIPSVVVNKTLTLSELEYSASIARARIVVEHHIEK